VGALLLAAGGARAASSDWGWDAASVTPAREAPGSERTFERWIRFYQARVAPLQGRDCPCVPSCSRYTMASMRKYGWLAGFFMGFERLFLRENRDMVLRWHYYTVPVGQDRNYTGPVGQDRKIFDPPEANDPFGPDDWRLVHPGYVAALGEARSCPEPLHR
jgi:hypothetical protein